jgi:hypothetical protein
VLLPVPDDEPVELGDELELGELGLVDGDDEDEPDVDGEDGDEVLGDVLGDADGVELLPGRSPTRSVRLSLQAVSRPRLSATAKTAVSILFIAMPPPCGVARPSQQNATAMPLPRGLTGRRTTITNAAVTVKETR